MASGVLEYHRPHGHPHIFCWHGPASPGATPHELWAGYLLCQHHLLVHPAARHLWSQQVPWSLCDDDWQDGERRQRRATVCLFAFLFLLEVSLVIFFTCSLVYLPTSLDLC